MTTMTKPASLAMAAALIAGAALAQEASFSATDANGDGVVTLSEFQAAFPEATAEQFAAADGDGDGDGALTAAEFATLIGG